MVLFGIQEAASSGAHPPFQPSECITSACALHLAENETWSGASDEESEGDAACAAPRQRYPDHVHDPLKVQHELGSAKAAALQCVTELYCGLLYVVLYHCHGQRRI